MTPLEIALQIYEIAAVIYAQAEKAKANKEQCKLVAERVRLVEEALKGLGTLKDTRQFCDSLENLKAYLEEILVFLKGFNDTRWVKRFIKAGGYQDRFEEIANQLAQKIQHLGLGLAAQTIINQEKDQRAQKADWSNLYAALDGIIQAERQVLLEQKRQGEKLEKLPHEMQDVIDITLQSTRIRVKEIHQALAEKKKSPPQPKPTDREQLDPSYRIRHFELTLQEELPTGRFGKMYRGQWEGAEVAIRWLPHTLSPDEEKLFINAVKLMSTLRHPTLPMFYGACLEEGRACLVTEHFPDGNLGAFLSQGPLTDQLTDQQSHQLMLDILSGLTYLHGRATSVIHGNLKPENVLMMRHANGKLLAKLSDARGIQSGYNMGLESQIAGKHLVAWSSPEMLRSQTPDTASDIYGFGLLLYLLCTGKQPYQKVQGSTREAILSGQRDSLEGIPDFYANIIKRCLQTNPKDRPHLEYLCQQFKSYTVRPTLRVEKSLHTPMAEAAVREMKASEITLLPPKVQMKESDQGKSLFKKALKLDIEGKKDEAKLLYLQAIQAGSVRAYANVGVLCLNEKPLAQTKETLGHFKQGAEQGDIKAMYLYAKLLMKRQEDTQKIDNVNSLLAIEWYQRSADFGYPKSQFALAMIYLQGVTEGGSKYLEKGVGLLQCAAENTQWKGVAKGRAQYKLAHCYEKGLGTVKNLERAEKCYAAATESGYASSRPTKNRESNGSLSSPLSRNSLFSPISPLSAETSSPRPETPTPDSAEQKKYSPSTT